jgi:hypothetical protein
LKCAADAQLHRLIGTITMEIDDGMTRAYPGKQGGEVEVLAHGGENNCVRQDDVIVATAAHIRERFRRETTKALGERRARETEEIIYGIENNDDAGQLAALLGSTGNDNGD